MMDELLSDKLLKENVKIIDGVICTVIAVIFNEKNKILMFFRQSEEWQSGWEPIKGKIHLDETEEIAVIREISEEAGKKVKTKIIGQLPDEYFGEKPGGTIKFKGRVFICKYINGEVKLGESEHVDYKWMNIKEAAEKNWLNRIARDGENIIEDAYEFYINNS
jgi:8-oxo-dGTP pyrophosphatase MutT (NUDIX family)